MHWSHKHLYIWVIDRGLDKWQVQVGKFKISGFYWGNHTQKVCIAVELLLLYNVCVDSAVWKVSVVERRRLSSQIILGDSVLRRSGWSWCLVQIVGVALWSGHRCSWRQLKMWTHVLEWLVDRYPGLFSPWLTGGMSMWPRSDGTSPSRFVTRGLESHCMIWSAAMRNAGDCCLVMQELLLQEPAAWWCWCLQFGVAGSSTTGVWC